MSDDGGLTSQVSSQKARAADLSDLDAVLEIVNQMFVDLGTETARTWREDAKQVLASRLWVDVAAFVVDHDGDPAACAIGILHDGLPSPRRIGAKVGYVEWVGTLPHYRRNGYARAVSAALVDWLAERGAAVIDLHSSAQAVPLYDSLGFKAPHATALRLRTVHSRPR